MVALIISPDGSGGSRRHPVSSLDGIDNAERAHPKLPETALSIHPALGDLSDTCSDDRLAILILHMNDDRHRRFEHDVNVL